MPPVSTGGLFSWFGVLLGLCSGVGGGAFGLGSDFASTTDANELTRDQQLQKLEVQVEVADRVRGRLSEALYEAVGLSRYECGDLVDTVLREISDTLTKGEAVKISSFGSFSVRQKGERIGRNPKTGEEVPITPRRVINFRASHVLKDLINSERTESGEGIALEASSSTELGRE